MTGRPTRIFYGRRKGRALRPGRRRLLDELLPRVRIEPDSGPIDPLALFERPVQDIWLEIGFGGGEHLAEQARRHPDVGLIGCEPFLNGVARLLGEIEQDGLRNIRVYADDARDLFERLPEACIGRAFVLFPDPWPKARHRRRRFIGPDTLQELSLIHI